jgi:predicted phospho-2-dehydro-3-deoxyheptonate aldolase
MYGKSLRLSRLFNLVTNKICIVPIDHGITMGPVKGLVDYISTIKQIIEGNADAVILHKGLLKRISHFPELSKTFYILHLSASTLLSKYPANKILVGTVEEAIKLGADAVSVHINLGTDNDVEMLKDFGRISKICNDWGMPLLAMMYTHNQDDVAYSILHAARIGEEIGADIIKIDYPGSMEYLLNIIETINVPIVIAGGKILKDSTDFLRVIDGAIKCGVSGVAVGRNIFQYNDPKIMTQLISGMLHRRISYEEAIRSLDEYTREVESVSVL